MIFEFIPGGGDNLSYLIGDREGGEGCVVDPVDTGLILQYIQRYGINLSYVINTHSHFDHTSGNSKILKSTKAVLAAHAMESNEISGVGRKLKDGEELKVGQLNIRIIHTPGHTSGGICLQVESMLITGDTLFLSGCGNPRFGGDPDQLFESVYKRLFPLDDHLALCPGHDYAVKNLGFALDRNPENSSAQKKLQEVKESHKRGEIPLSTLGEEKSYNPFFRLDSEEIFQQLQKKKSSLKHEPREIFKALRELRNTW